jgi:hypothetical protein
VQRLLSVAASGSTHAAWHQAVIGPGDRCHGEWPLTEVNRSRDLSHPGKVSMTAALRRELDVPTLAGHPTAETDSREAVFDG